MEIAFANALFILSFSRIWLDFICDANSDSLHDINPIETVIENIAIFMNASTQKSWHTKQCCKLSANQQSLHGIISKLNEKDARFKGKKIMCAMENLIHFRIDDRFSFMPLNTYTPYV